jgi:uncharacterized damage-inducible protein DinB
MDNTIKQLIFKLQESFDGTPWFGESLMTKLNSVDFNIVNCQPFPSLNSISRLVQHIINWRIFVIRKLQDDREFDIELNDANDWTEVHINNDQAWSQLKTSLQDTQQKIIDLLSAKDNVFLMQKVPGRQYDYQYLIEGLVQHDIYHLGQIGLVKKLAEYKYAATGNTGLQPATGDE